MADATKFVPVTVLDGSLSGHPPTSWAPLGPVPAPPPLGLPLQAVLCLWRGRRAPYHHHSRTKSQASSPSPTERRARQFEVFQDDDRPARTQQQPSPTRRRSKTIAAGTLGAQAQAHNAAKRQWRLAARNDEEEDARRGRSSTATPNKSALKPSSRHLNQSLPVTPSSRPSKTVPLTSAPSGNKENVSIVLPTCTALGPGDDDTEAARLADEVARLEAETDRILAEQKKRDLARLQAQLTLIPTPPHKPKPKHLILDKLPFFLPKSARSNGTSQPTTPQSAPAKTLAFVWSPTLGSGDHATSPQSMYSIEPGGGGIVPQTDAPTSAINGGERRVTVRYLTSTINLPVNTNTTPVDVAYSTANFVTHDITPTACVIIECYEVLGFERRLRQYERIRDVMNSWDRDQQNTLLVTSVDDTAQPDADLKLATVPRTNDPPTGFTFQLYHSARPGRWNKRWVTLMDTGQIYASKKPDAKPTDKDSAALCHLSDFDIYTPRETQMRRHLKPPKKFCYAIKSQQKTHLFPNGENFVHFFSVDDEQLAHRFYELIHGWRSWYLVNKKIDFEGREQPSSPPVRRSGTTRTTSGSVSKAAPPHKTAMGGQPSYTIGEFKPLLDMSEFDKPLEEFGKRQSKLVKSPQEPAVQSVTTNKAHNQLPSNTGLISPQAEEEFSSGGLLGESYDKRKAKEAVGTEPKKTESPFIEGTLLNRPATASATPVEKPDQGSWFPSAQEHSARNRPQPKPSVRRPRTAGASQPRRDDAPPPMPGFHSIPNLPTRGPSQRHDIGRAVKPPAGSPLIEFATGGVTNSQAMPARSAIKGPPPHGHGLPPNRPRSRSTASSRADGPRMPPSSRPPLPPMPHHLARRPDERERAGSSTTSSSHRSRDPRHQGPLINRVK
ncbi:uncharacterized protein F5Z01DRAFT_53130 [Emericellopsis atlantica]|uniref:PH domain-containing protein n=1 Tax=Emericellopsis atlantica TaxID=2614577 RepID=A0A9P7ZNZ2_9HYPO|nr:uncharacterized protein F5Z01DRAFT_53130 [Emericellopsis atlantica]KAG9255431.1 hypothetical protein F5Z01DRAFT_53130 [Emericellopsis atlantica]